MNDRVCRDSDRLRNPERLLRLEIDRVAGLCLEIPGTRSVLDVGTGTGVFAEAFVARGLAVTGVDIQESMLEGARSHVPAARFLLAPSECLPFEDGVFDLVFMGLVLHETESAERLAPRERVPGGDERRRRGGHVERIDRLDAVVTIAMRRRAGRRSGMLLPGLCLRA